MIDKSKVLEIVKLKGPVIPRDIVKEIGGDTFIIGAVLSQLVDNKEIKITHAKIGGSPCYYYTGQENKLNKLYDYLHEKEKRAYDLLKQKKIIRDNDADPLLKVVLRQVKDFAKPLEVNIRGEKEIFWKWYLLQNSEAEPIIRNLVSGEAKTPEIKNSENKDKEKEIIKQEQETTEKPKEEKKESQEKLDKQEKEEKEKDDELLSKITQLFKEKNIEILEKNIIRKNQDFEFILKIPSVVGEIKYFCKVKDKKKTNDKDLSSYFVEGQMKNLPILYITTGEITKKAEEKLEKEYTTITMFQI